MDDSAAQFSPPEGPFAQLPGFEADLLAATYAPQGVVTARNETWEAVFGRQEDPWARLSDEDRAMVTQRLAEATAGMLVTNQLLSVTLHARDEPLPVLLHLLPVRLPADDGALRVAAVTMTGEVLAEPMTWTRSQTQRHRLEALGRMTMGIAHDFNNLLSAILGHIELLKGHRELSHSLQEQLRTIEQAALDGATLVRKIQQFIRQEKEEKFEPVDLPSLVQDCVSLTRPYWYNEPRRQGIDIQVEQDLREVPPVMGSPTELREVLVNLILNAVQAMPEGGTISFDTRFQRDRGAMLCVTDTGAGMSETVRKRIFEPLFSTKGERGSGMGLAVSYGLVQEHDGTIEVESRLGEGTRFMLTFPPAQETAPAETPEVETVPHRAARVLVVDDEQMVRSVLTRLLTLRGHTVEQAASGPEALTITESASFDVAFVDQAMPEMNGRDLAVRLRERFPDLPIVLLTGDTNVGEPDATINAIMSKPFKLDDLDAMIQSLLQERS